jgi:hypothetical protein
MSILDTIKSVFSRGTPARGEPQQSFDIENFIYIKIPGDIQPLDRGSRFEDLIDSALAHANLGATSGGGSSLGNPGPDGSRRIEFCGIDFDATDRDGALASLRTLLPDLNAPIGTELHYTCGGIKLQDVLSVKGWQLGLPRSFTHPGFGI